MNSRLPLSIDPALKIFAEAKTVLFSSEFKYALLIFALFIIPRFLIKYHIQAFP